MILMPRLWFVTWWKAHHSALCPPVSAPPRSRACTNRLALLDLDCKAPWQRRHLHAALGLQQFCKMA